MQRQGISEAQLDNLVWPVDTYASLALLLPIGILAEKLSYRAVIIFGLVNINVTWLLLIYGEGVWMMQVMQVIYIIYFKRLVFQSVQV